MAIYKLQEMPSLYGVGEKRVFPKMVINRQLSTKEFIEKMHSLHPAMSTGNIAAVLSETADFLVYMLSMGYTVKLDELGTFSLSLDFADEKPKKMKDENDKMPYRKVTVKNVNFKVSPELLKRLKRETTLERDSSGVNCLNQKKYTLDEHIQRGKNWLKHHAFFTLQEYANMNELSRTAASLELKSLTTGEEATFGYTGSGSHKIWINKK